MRKPSFKSSLQHECSLEKYIVARDLFKLSLCKLVFHKSIGGPELEVEPIPQSLCQWLDL